MQNEYRYIVKARTQQKIRRFYQNVARKYKHTYDLDDLARDIQKAVFSIYQIERTLLRRKPTISRWTGYYMANTDKWYFAYIIEGDNIVVVDACHAQNMHEDILSD